VLPLLPLSEEGAVFATRVLGGYDLPQTQSRAFARLCPPPIHALRRALDLDKQLQIVLANKGLRLDQL